MLPDQFLLPSVASVAIDSPLATMQQVRQRVLVMHIRCARGHRVNQLGLAVDADVGLHPEVPLVALLRLLHLRVPLALLVLGRAWRVDDGGIDTNCGIASESYNASSAAGSERLNHCCRK